MNKYLTLAAVNITIIVCVTVLLLNDIYWGLLLIIFMLIPSYPPKDKP